MRNSASPFPPHFLFSGASLSPSFSLATTFNVVQLRQVYARAARHLQVYFAQVHHKHMHTGLGYRVDTRFRDHGLRPQKARSRNLGLTQSLVLNTLSLPPSPSVLRHGSNERKRRLVARSARDGLRGSQFGCARGFGFATIPAFVFPTEWQGGCGPGLDWLFNLSIPLPNLSQPNQDHQSLCHPV